MNERGKSDRPVVPRKPPNKGEGALSPAEGVEGRGLAKENPLRQNQSIGHRAAPDWQSALERIRQAAKKDRDVRFTALWHHVANVHRLREEYFALKHNSAPGVDGQTWRQYGGNLEANLQDLSGRLHRGAYHAKPVQRAWIPKPDGRQRPIGIPTLEDKIVQGGCRRAGPETPTGRLAKTGGHDQEGYKRSERADEKDPCNRQEAIHGRANCGPVDPDVSVRPSGTEETARSDSKRIHVDTGIGADRAAVP